MRRGTSLSETLIALAILGLVTTAVMSAVANSYRLGEQSKAMSLASQLASSQLESFSAASLGSGWNTFVADDQLKLSPQGNFCYRVRVTQVSVDLRKAVCEVYFQAQGSSEARIDRSRPNAGLALKATTMVYRD